MTRAAMMLTSVMIVSLGAGCAQIPLHANQSDAELHQNLAENFPAGMSRATVESKLAELKVSEKTREFYDMLPAPPQLLVRLYQPGGFWLDEEDQIVRWVDAVFVFNRAEPPTLDRTETFRGSQRYWHGDPVNIPPTPTKYPWGRYPISPPPPLEPPVTR